MSLCKVESGVRVAAVLQARYYRKVVMSHSRQGLFQEICSVLARGGVPGRGTRPCPWASRTWPYLTSTSVFCLPTPVFDELDCPSLPYLMGMATLASRSVASGSEREDVGECICHSGRER